MVTVSGLKVPFLLSPGIQHKQCLQTTSGDVISTTMTLSMAYLFLLMSEFPMPSLSFVKIARFVQVFQRGSDTDGINFYFWHQNHVRKNFTSANRINFCKTMHFALLMLNPYKLKIFPMCRKKSTSR